MPRQTRRRRRSRRIRLTPRFYIIAALFILAIVMGVLMLTTLFGDREDAQAPASASPTPTAQAGISPDAQAEEEPGFFAKLFGKDGDADADKEPGFFAKLFGKDQDEAGGGDETEDKPGFFAGLFDKEADATPTPLPTPIPEPTPTPVPTFSPVNAAGSRPEDFGLSWEAEQEGQTLALGSYRNPESIDFLEPEKYTQLEGVIGFRGNNFRDSAAYGTAEVVERRLDVENAWTATVGSIPKEYGEGSWSGCGWTGQPLIVRWPAETKAHMNLYESAKNDPNLVEVIYATMDGRIYFFNLETGEKTRDYISLGYAFKGAGALDPRGYPLMYLGAGDNSQSGKARAFIVSLIDGRVLHEFGEEDGYALRDWTAYDASALVDAETDTLIYPGENGVVYLIRLNSKYDEAAGTISIAPKTIKWRYKGARTNSTDTVSGAEGWWLGIEDSPVAWRGHLFFTDNGGHMICLDLNTLQVVWVQDTLDDTNCTPVFELEGDMHQPYIYTSTSFHAGWRKAEDEVASIPIWKIDANNGQVIWENTDHYCGTIADVSGGVQGTLAMGKHKLSDMIFVPVAMTEGSKGKLVALSKADGHEIWCCDFQGYPWSSPVAFYDKAGNGYIIQCNKSGYIHLIDGMTGEILYEASLGSNIEASPAIYNDSIVVGTRGGLIYGIKIK